MQHLPVDIGHEFSKLEIDHPRTVLAFAAILHQRRKRTELGPAQQEVVAAIGVGRASVPSNVRPKVGVARPCTLEISVECLSEPFKCIIYGFR